MLHRLEINHPYVFNHFDNYVKKYHFADIQIDRLLGGKHIDYLIYIFVLLPFLGVTVTLLLADRAAQLSSQEEGHTVRLRSSLGEDNLNI